VNPFLWFYRKIYLLYDSFGNLEVSPGLALRSVVVLISIALYALSLSQPAILLRLPASSLPHSIPAPMHRYTGYQMLQWNILGPFRANFAGVANLLLLLGWFFLLTGKMRNAFASSFAAGILSLQTFQMILIPIPLDESGGNYAEFIRPLSGYYLWVGSILTVIAFTTIFKLQAAHISPHARPSPVLPQTEPAETPRDSSLAQTPSSAPELMQQRSKLSLELLALIRHRISIVLLLPVRL
jgi:hypothetical protein